MSLFRNDLTDIFMCPPNASFELRISPYWYTCNIYEGPERSVRAKYIAPSALLGQLKMTTMSMPPPVCALPPSPARKLWYPLFMEPAITA